MRRPDTEDLLSVRDGEPVDGDLEARILRDAGSARELARLERVQRALRALPELAPPPGVFSRVTAEVSASPPPRRAFPRSAAAGIAAAGVLAVLAAALFVRAPDPPLSAGDSAAPGIEDGAPNLAAGEPAPYAPLIAESALLERRLAELRARPRLMNAGTAGTIAGLEDTIAALDAELTFAAAEDVDPRQREALWRERVDVMHALLQVRYAQSERMVF
jgi:hypothetical protein